MEYFKYFPKIQYGGKPAIDMLARTKVRNLVLNNSYYVEKYTIAESERADIIADRVYGSARFTWIIYYANNIIDPLVDWPMDYQSFLNFLIEKYGSVELAQSTVHHYLYKDQYIINKNEYDNQPYLFYTPNGTENYVFEIGQGVTIYNDDTATALSGTIVNQNSNYIEFSPDESFSHETLESLPIEGNKRLVGQVFPYPTQTYTMYYFLGNLKSSVSCYDYEEQLNESRRDIILIKPSYVGKIMDEFRRLYEQ
jgi:hypothetical protein